VVGLGKFHIFVRELLVLRGDDTALAERLPFGRAHFAVDNDEVALLIGLAGLGFVEGTVAVLLAESAANNLRLPLVTPPLRFILGLVLPALSWLLLDESPACIRLNPKRN